MLRLVIADEGIHSWDCGVGLRGTSWDFIHHLSPPFLAPSDHRESRLPRESFKRRLVGVSWQRVVKVLFRKFSYLHFV